jgi:AcrR family transcriptional regulator
LSIPTRVTAEVRRAAILDAALCLFSERGLRGTTTRALADAVGVSEPVLYEHFRSKHELYAAIIEAKSQEGVARCMARLEPLARAKQDRPFFIALGEIVLDSYTKDRAYSRLLVSGALEDPELGRLFYERQCPAREGLASYIAERINDGAFRPVDPRVAARAFIGMLAHHGMMGMLYQDDFINAAPEKIVEGMVDIFLRGIATENTRV